MKNYKSQMKDYKLYEKVLKALANKRRLAIVSYLRKEKEATVGSVSDNIKLSFRATSRHLAVLYNADVVEKEQRGLEMWYRLSDNLDHIAKHVVNSL